MRVLLGIVLGALLTVLSAYAYDMNSGRPAMVNWDVAAKNWQELGADMREMGARVQAALTKRSG